MARHTKTRTDKAEKTIIEIVEYLSPENLESSMVAIVAQELLTFDGNPSNGTLSEALSEMTNQGASVAIADIALELKMLEDKVERARYWVNVVENDLRAQRKYERDHNMNEKRS